MFFINTYTGKDAAYEISRENFRIYRAVKSKLIWYFFNTLIKQLKWTLLKKCITCEFHVTFVWNTREDEFTRNWDTLWNLCELRFTSISNVAIFFVYRGVARRLFKSGHKMIEETSLGVKAPGVSLR